MKFPMACCLLKFTLFNLFPRKYAHSFLSAGVGSLRSFTAWRMVLGFDRLAGMMFFSRVYHHLIESIAKPAPTQPPPNGKEKLFMSILYNMSHLGEVPAWAEGALPPFLPRTWLYFH